MRIGTAIVLYLLLGTASAQEMALADFPFWQQNAGWWRSTNTYFDGDLNYAIRSYNSVIHIELDGRTFRETEYKSYAPGKLAIARGAGRISEGEGLEVVTVTTGELVDEFGTVRITGSNPPIPGVTATTISVLDDSNGARVTRDPNTGLEAYRMLISLPAADRRYIANYGLVSSANKPSTAASDPGDLRGFSLFRGTRIAAQDAPGWRQEHRVINRVAAIIEAGETGAPVLRRLDED